MSPTANLDPRYPADPGYGVGSSQVPQVSEPRIGDDVDSALNYVETAHAIVADIFGRLHGVEAVSNGQASAANGTQGTPPVRVLSRRLSERAAMLCRELGMLREAL